MHRTHRSHTMITDVNHAAGTQLVQHASPQASMVYSFEHRCLGVIQVASSSRQHNAHCKARRPKQDKSEYLVKSYAMPSGK